jgi:hypothetical protein
MEPQVNETQSDEEPKQFGEKPIDAGYDGEPMEEKQFKMMEPHHSRGRGGKHHKKAGLKDFTDWLDQQANLYTAQQTVRSIIGTLLFFGYIWGCIWIAICQGIYLYCIRQAMKKQAILETRFMGAEHPQIQAQQALPMAQPQQAYIQYVSVPQTYIPVEQVAPARTGTIVADQNSMI